MHTPMVTCFINNGCGDWFFTNSVPQCVPSSFAWGEGAEVRTMSEQRPKTKICYFLKNKAELAKN